MPPTSDHTTPGAYAWFLIVSGDGNEPSSRVSGTTVASLRTYVKEALARAFPARRHDQLVDLSALASDSAILPESHLLGDADLSLCILPPVCGG